MQGTNGKGDTRRPSQVSDAVWSENWDRAFGKEQRCSGTKNSTKTNSPTTTLTNLIGSVAPALEHEIKTRTNAGIECDMVKGPCACGAWH